MDEAKKSSEEEEEQEEVAKKRNEEEEDGETWWAKRSWECLKAVRERGPLIQCITNFVSMDIMANTLLASGASPAMVHGLHEIPDFTPYAQALCVNIGTLAPDWIPSMKAAASLAVRSAIPWVLDPVAVSASHFRMNTCLDLLQLSPTVIRGNVSRPVPGNTIIYQIRPTLHVLAEGYGTDGLV